MSTWQITRLDEVAELCLGKMLDARKNIGQLRPYLRNANVRWGAFDLTDLQEMPFEDRELSRYSVTNGDLVGCEGGEPGRCAVWRGRQAMFIQKALHRVRSRDVIDPTYLAHFLRHLADSGELAESFTGTTIKHLPGVKLAALLVRYPSRDEQHRIVTAIETHFSRLDAAVALLQRAKANIARARASVLKAAVEGRLVPTEAALARVEGRSFEPAAVLLERILVEREAAWKASGARGKYQALVRPEVEGLPELPDGWCWARMDQLADVVGGITKDGKVSEGRLVPYLRVANVQRGRLDLTEVKEILASEAKIAALRLLPGDILLNEGGDRDKLGRGWVWAGEIDECIHQNHVFRARVWAGGLDARYVSHYANSCGGNYFLDQGKQTTNLASISLSKVKALPIPLPPSGEIVRILSETDRRLTTLAAIESTLDTNLARCARLRQSILQRAFEGRLVPAADASSSAPPGAP